MTDPRHPIGTFSYQGPTTPEQRAARIADLTTAPAKLRAAVQGLTDPQLDTPYRDGGWTVRQLVHHVADSHINAYVRCKLALTEDEPTIKPYDQDRWAALPDGRMGPITASLQVLDAVHERWVRLLGSLDAAAFGRRLRHPESGVMDLDKLLALYAWHGKHHVAHIRTLRDRMGW